MSLPADVPAPRSGPHHRAAIGVAGIVLVVISVLGLGLGEFWRVVTPRIQIIRVDQGFVYADAEPEQAIAADGWFLFLGLGAGLLLGVLAWIVLRRYRGVAMLVGLVLGSLIGAWLAWWLGVRIDQTHFEALARTVPVGSHLDAPLSLRITGLDRTHLWPPKLTGVVLAQPLSAAIAYTTLAGFSSDSGLRPMSARVGEEPGAPQTLGPPYEGQLHPGASSDPGGSAGPADSPAPPASE
ncbi:MAG TPA: hypothetical protein VH561_02040 [Micromonosporaceae bacterium]